MLEDIHCRIALSVLFFTFALGVWGVGSFALRRGVDSSYRGALVIGELLILFQGIVGIVLVLMGKWPNDTLHLLYGVVLALAWPLVYTYTHADSSRRAVGIYGVMSFVMVFLALRALYTGSGGFTAPCLPH